MSEMAVIAEYIRNAMQAVEETHKAGEELKKDPKAENLDSLRAQMNELQNHLSKLLTVLNNEEAYAIDELVDALTRIYTGHVAEYRRTPRMAEE
jgi:Tfp pilus assembly protein PilO